MFRKPFINTRSELQLELGVTGNMKSEYSTYHCYNCKLNRSNIFHAISQLDAVVLKFNWNFESITWRPFRTSGVNYKGNWRSHSCHLNTDSAQEKTISHNQIGCRFTNYTIIIILILTSLSFNWFWIYRKFSLLRSQLNLSWLRLV